MQNAIPRHGCGQTGVDKIKKDEHTEEIIYGRTDGRHSDAGSGSADIGC